MKKRPTPTAKARAAKAVKRETYNAADLAAILPGMRGGQMMTVNGFDIMRAASGPDLELFHARRAGSRTWSARRTAHGVQEIVFPPAIPTRDAEQKALCHEMMASLPTQLAPTFDALTAAWDGLDTALLSLAAALRENAGAPAPSGLSESFMLQLLTLILRQPPAQSSGG